MDEARRGELAELVRQHAYLYGSHFGEGAATSSEVQAAFDAIVRWVEGREAKQRAWVKDACDYIDRMRWQSNEPTDADDGSELIEAAAELWPDGERSRG